MLNNSPRRDHRGLCTCEEDQMWSYEILGTHIYHLLAAFVLYSVLGWALESTYMSFCNRKLTNRGFGKGPFCPIYGFGGVLGYLILSPLRDKLVELYFLGAILATAFEYLVGVGMIRFLGELWWDYNNKPFNYRGIICLESTVAWGFYAIGIVQFVHDAMYHIIDKVQLQIGTRLIQGILLLVAIDYTVQLIKVFDIDVRSKGEALKERCQALIATRPYLLEKDRGVWLFYAKNQEIYLHGDLAIQHQYAGILVERNQCMCRTGSDRSSQCGASGELHREGDL